MSHKYAFNNLSKVNTAFFLGTPIVGIALTWYWASVDFSWGIVWAAVVYYFMTGMSITAGYHRFIAHKAFEAHPIIKFLFLFFGAGAFQQSAFEWSCEHRVHHKEVDTDEDPYNINEGFFYAHLGWLLLHKNTDVDDRFAKDLVKDELVQWQYKNYYIIALVSAFLFPTLIGGLFFGSFLGGFAVIGVLRMVILHHSTFFINSLCHYLGTTPYTDTNTAKDSWFMALLTFGEGYHNFHHYFQADYRNGVKWYQYDPSKWLIMLLSKIGLASKLKVTPESKITGAELQMMLKREISKQAFDTKIIDELERLKEKAISCLKILEDLKKEYSNMKANNLLVKLPEVQIKQLQESMIKAKDDFKESIASFHNLIQNPNQRLLTH